MSTILKFSEKNIIGFWFAEATPIQKYKIKMNPNLWAACQQVSEEFKAPSGIPNPKQYRKSDKVAFAKLVLVRLAAKEMASQQDIFELA
ncbi:hypothetical protein GCM10028819_06960 [Spirosoma humi]